MLSRPENSEKQMSEAKHHKLAARRAFIKAHAGDPKSVLEIGALNAPVYRNKSKVQYADRLSTAELIKRYPDKANIVNVDYVLSDAKFSAQIPERFHCIIANLVVAHVPDVINWFDQLANVLLPNGMIFLAVPDKRYTSDIVRPLTTLADLVDCAHRELLTPSLGQLFAHLYMHRKVSAQDIWDGKYVDVSQPRMGAGRAVRMALSMVDSYHSVHCHVFTYDSFAELMDQMYQANLSDWAIHARREPLNGGNEFMVALKRAR